MLVKTLKFDQILKVSGEYFFLLAGHKWDGSLFLDFHTINHDEMNRVLLTVFNSFIITCFIIVQSCTVFQSCTIIQCYTTV